MEANILACVKTGKVFFRDAGNLPDPEDPAYMLMPVGDAEPYYEQLTRSRAAAHERTDDGKYDRSHLSPENAYRIGREFFAHAVRYGWPMRLIRNHFGAGARIIEMGCGKELPMFRTLTMDLSAVTYYKPSVYVGADLNNIRYNPRINGIDTHVLSNTNIITDDSKVPDIPFDLIVSFEVLEHMDKLPDGEAFLDGAFKFARRKPDAGEGYSIIALSTPVNGGHIAKNHIYEWKRSELERAFIKRGGEVLAEHGTFANLRDLLGVLSESEREVWNDWAEYHSPHVLSCMFATAHPEVARNIAWEVKVS